MAHQNLFEALERITGFTALESDMFEIINAVDKDRAERDKPHRIKIAHLRKLEWLLRDEEITYSRMVEILNEIAAGKHKNGIEL